MPAFAVGVGGVMLAARWGNGDPGGGLISLAIMLGFAVALVAFSGRSGVLEVMRNPATDERTSALDLCATAFSGLVVIFVLVGAFLYELARGRDPSPYTQLCAVAGVSYLAALVVLQRRS